MAYSTISKPSLHFNTKLYTGNGNTQSITGVGFQPDLTWIKNRTNSSTEHYLYDAVRGAGKSVRSSSDIAEATETNQLTAFDSDGFSIGNWGDGNTNSSNIVSWNWKANGAGSADTNGTINSTVSVNTTAGFSIVSWTGTGSAGTIGHGLGVKPAMIISKNRDEAQNWFCYHTSLGATKYIRLNLTNTSGTSSAIWNDTEPTTSLFSVGNDTAVNGSGDAMIAYCFAEKTGYSKIGSYKGNGNTNGTFIYTGFKPAFVIIKNSSTGSYSWTVNDTARTPSNVMDKWLYPNSTTAEATGSSYNMDLLSNGFKSRNTGSNTNDANNQYIYIAIAEEPLVANVGASIPATAR